MTTLHSHRADGHSHDGHSHRADGHTHGGPYPRGSDPSEEQPYDDAVPDRPEYLVLDIGGDVGALVLYADESCLGQEIDLTPVGEPRSHHVHTMIRRRRSPQGDFVAGVYPELLQGSYTVWGLDGQPIGVVTISGGAVAEFHAGSCRSTLAQAV